MTIKTAQAWGWIDDGRLFGGWTSENCKNTPVVIVHGLTESEVHEAAALLEAIRKPGAVKLAEPEVCEWNKVVPPPTHDGYPYYYRTSCAIEVYMNSDKERPCWCGLRVEVKE